MKYETYSEYNPRHTALAESAFRRVEPALARWLHHRPGRAGLPHPVLPVEGSLRLS